MQVLSSLKEAKKRSRDCQIVRLRDREAAGQCVSSTPASGTVNVCQACLLRFFAPP